MYGYFYEYLKTGGWLRNADLSEADLRKADLRNANLRNADLWNADLRKADLRKADLRKADLRKADLSEAISLSQEDCLLPLHTTIWTGTRHQIVVLGPYLKIGCKIKKATEWLKVTKSNSLNDNEIRIYHKYIQFVVDVQAS